MRWTHSIPVGRYDFLPFLPVARGQRGVGKKTEDALLVSS